MGVAPSAALTKTEPTPAAWACSAIAAGSPPSEALRSQIQTARSSSEAVVPLTSAPDAEPAPKSSERSAPTVIVAARRRPSQRRLADVTDDTRRYRRTGPRTASDARSLARAAGAWERGPPR